MANVLNTIEELNDLMNSENECEYTDMLDGKLERVSSKICEPLNVLHLNVRGFHKNSDSIILLLSDLEAKAVVVHVLALCETFLTKATVVTAELENYLAVHHVRDERTGGGTSVYVHDCVKLLKTYQLLHNDSFEAVGVRLKFKNASFNVVELYRPPNSNIDDYFLCLTECINLLKKDSINVICGDFNLDLIKSYMHKCTNKMLSLMIDHSYVPFITKPTCVTHRTSTLIDNIYVSSKNINKNCSFVLSDPMSDHYPCLLSYSLAKSKIKTDELTIEKRKITDDVISWMQQKTPVSRLECNFCFASHY